MNNNTTAPTYTLRGLQIIEGVLHITPTNQL